jgi:hypothetical protein
MKSAMQKNASIKKYAGKNGKRRTISPIKIYMPCVLYSCISFIPFRIYATKQILYPLIPIQRHGTYFRIV